MFTKKQPTTQQASRMDDDATHTCLITEILIKEMGILL